MTCRYLHKLCPKGGCENYVCRAYFPDKQPLLKKDMLPMCRGTEHEECLRYIEGNALRIERKLKSLDEHCPFATNTRCGRPWEWWCKGGNYPFLLTTYEVKEGTMDTPIRDVEGNVKLTRKVEDLKEVCFSGKTDVYEGCPNYQQGVALREYARELKKREK